MKTIRNILALLTMINCVYILLLCSLGYEIPVWSIVTFLIFMPGSLIVAIIYFIKRKM